MPTGLGPLPGFVVAVTALQAPVVLVELKLPAALSWSSFPVAASLALSRGVFLNLAPLTSLPLAYPLSHSSAITWSLSHVVTPFGRDRK